MHQSPTIVSPDPRKSLRPRESHPGVIPDDPGLSRIKTFDRRQWWPRSSVTLSDVARRKRSGDTYLRKNLLAMLESVEAHARAIRSFGITPGRVTATLGDSRDLRACGIEESSVDAIVTSPPYSIALDYVKNDDHALVALGVDTEELRDSMTGVRGQGAKDKLRLYNSDIVTMFGEVARILKPGGRAAFVIGDATVDGREYTTTDQMSNWAVGAGLALEQSIPKIVYGLYGMFQDEQILIFREP